MPRYFVSPSGNDAHSGKSQREAFRTVSRGIKKLKKGDELNLLEGSYVETLKIENLHGTSPDEPIVIRSFGNQHATIDGYISPFSRGEDCEWKPARLEDPEAVEDEFVSCAVFRINFKDRTNRGAFIEREPYTRLITYSRLEDLRSPNQTFVRPLPEDETERDGPQVFDEEGNFTTDRVPWVYMGPGLYFNMDTGRVHIRLSHTTNNVKGLEDYAGETNPTLLRLAISSKAMTTLEIKNSSFIRFENLSVRFGGEHCVLLEETKGIVFDHVRILAASVGVFFQKGNSGTALRHCEIRGGIPPWYFRSDRKAEYNFRVCGDVVTNQLGKQTSLGLLAGTESNRDIEVSNCELLDAHDITLFGKTFKFHHNWIDNVNDDSLFIDAVEGSDDLRIFQNVFTRCLSAVSYAGKKPGGKAFIYRNLFDLRQPTAGIRPTSVDDKDVFRHGQFLKEGEQPEGPLDLFHNTCIVFGPQVHAYFRHYANTKGGEPRRSLNNIFVAIDPNSTNKTPITFIPPATFPGPTDGNCYFRQSKANERLFEVVLGKNKFLFFASIRKLKSSTFFGDTQEQQYPPGYEDSSLDVDPKFRRIGGKVSASEVDDLRLSDGSPAKGRGVVLRENFSELADLDPLAPGPDRPDMGCYQTGKPGLDVGVDGRNHFPLDVDKKTLGATGNRPRRRK